VPDSNKWKPYLEMGAGLLGGAAGGFTAIPRQAAQDTLAAFQRSGIDPSLADITQALDKI